MSHEPHSEPLIVWRDRFEDFLNVHLPDHVIVLWLSFLVLSVLYCIVLSFGCLVFVLWLPCLAEVLSGGYLVVSLSYLILPCLVLCCVVMCCLCRIALSFLSCLVLSYLVVVLPCGRIVLCCIILPCLCDVLRFVVLCLVLFCFCLVLCFVV